MTQPFRIVAIALMGMGIFSTLNLAPAEESGAADPTEPWPPITSTHQPGVIWWVPGSAMDRDNLTENLRQLRSAGFGGVSMVPIYGVKGAEDHFLPYLSPQWIEMFEFASRETRRLGLWLDLTPGTGWRIGGPNVTPEMGELRIKLSEGKLAPSRSNAKVKRAAPGGAGLSIDPYSVAALQQHLRFFDQNFSELTAERPRAFYHDSFEYNGSWTDGFLDTFRQKHPYDLADYAAELFGEGDQETAARVQRDYRDTISDLHYDFVTLLHQWAGERGSSLREQAHGAPGNLLDLYALADIPETEVFGANSFSIPGFRREERFVAPTKDSSPLVNRFASSAAHLSGHPLVSSESFTWLREHFNTALSQIKAEVDLLFLSGVNHLLYHGNCYSPKDATWPGWLFYASTEVNSRNAFWHDLPTLNSYIARCQSILQSGSPDNDVLLYWPIEDVYSSVQKDPLFFFRVHNHETWLTNTSCGELAAELSDRGIAYDFVSDRLLGRARVVKGKVVCGNSSYDCIAIPKTQFMPMATLRQIQSLLQAGGQVVFADGLPTDVPGLGNLDQRRDTFQQLAEQVRETIGDQNLSNESTSVLQRLVSAGVRPEPMAQSELASIRRKVGDDTFYFIVNQSAKDFDDGFTLSRTAAAAVVMDPMTGKLGQATIRNRVDEKGTRLYLQLAAGQSVFIRLQAKDAGLPPLPIWQPAGDPIPIRGDWEITFLDGGPELPNPIETTHLACWTELGDTEAVRFAGTARYRIEFDAPSVSADGWRLDLGDVRESANVRLNGSPIASLVAHPFRCHLDLLREHSNVLEIEVTNLSANRIRDLDRRGVPWKIFYDINFVDIHYRPFDASDWPIRPSGLLGPIRLQPLASPTLDALSAIQG
ncbi:glycosyl hydrolase [Novipirellula artificiosorum]|uniref:Glycosyl hydrolases family 2, sugar binding domain n=1 Tax=Novipirellula artificiosorum TaxID=2528016 RepID=A0A5C6DGS5_9BACT|nr:glycosyl hydrolase [Novipirellula artificiosorum]TWU35027.1 hypothetical protein Poly41_41710 [Novipirellula artificiosorum]